MVAFNAFYDWESSASRILEGDPLFFHFFGKNYLLISKSKRVRESERDLTP